MVKPYLTFDSTSIARTGGFDTTYMCRQTRHYIDKDNLFELLKVFDAEWSDEWYGDNIIGNILTFNSQEECDRFIAVSTIIAD
jgi:hypothetical protein